MSAKRQVDSEAPAPGTSRSSFWASKRKKLDAEKATLLKLDSLKPGFSNNFIRVLITFKARGNGPEFMCFKGLDDTKEVLIKAFQAESKKAAVFKVGRTYTISVFKIEDRFGLNVVLTPGSTITSLDSNPDGVVIAYNRLTLSDVSSAPYGQEIDALGYICEVEILGAMGQKSIIITDESKEEVLVSMWKRDIEIKFNVGDILRLRQAKKGSGCITTNWLTDITINPNDEEATEFKERIAALLAEDEEQTGEEIADIVA